MAGMDKKETGLAPQVNFVYGSHYIVREDAGQISRMPVIMMLTRREWGGGQWALEQSIAGEKEPQHQN
jgi:hypothetical protein